MFSKSQNVLHGTLLFVAVATSCVLIAALYEATWGDIAQSMATILAAGLAALLVALQIKTSGDQSLAQQRASLKLQLYKEIAQKVDLSIRPIVELGGLSTNYAGQLDVYDLSNQRVLPTLRYEELRLKSAEKFESVSAIRRLIEDWIAVDKNLDLFHLAINCAEHEVEESYTSFLKEVEPHLAMSLKNLDGKVEAVFIAPSNEKRKAILQKGAALHENCITLMAYCGDFRDQMQMSLLRDFFDCAHIPTRQSKDPKFKVLRLEDATQLKEYFTKHTAFGQRFGAE